MGEILISEVERELTRLWRGAVSPPAAENAGAAAQPVVMRVTTMNLIVAGCGTEREGLSQVLAETTRQHPCRAIVIEKDPSRSEPRAWVSMMCHTAARDWPQVCSEEIVLSGPPSATHEIFGSVAGLLVADVPTFVWWRARLPESADEQERFAHIAPLADRFLFDSGRCAGEHLAGIAALAAADRIRCFGDVNWARLLPWRAHVAQLFDPPAARQLIGKIESARILHEAAQPDSGTRLMAGWLRSRLGRFPIEFAKAETPSVELRAAGELLTVPRPDILTESQALSQELRVLGRDEPFEQALAAAATEL